MPRHAFRRYTPVIKTYHMLTIIYLLVMLGCFYLFYKSVDFFENI
jgi:hypothetical protein